MTSEGSYLLCRGGMKQCYWGQCVLCPEMKRLSGLRLNMPCLWKTKAGRRESELCKPFAWPLLQSLRCLIVLLVLFFFFSTVFCFLISPYPLLAAYRHCVQLISWPKQGPRGKTNPTANLLCACGSSITALLGKLAWCYPWHGGVGTLQAKSLHDIGGEISKCFPAAFCGWGALLHWVSVS